MPCVSRVAGVRSGAARLHHRCHCKCGSRTSLQSACHGARTNSRRSATAAALPPSRRLRVGPAARWHARTRRVARVSRRHAHAHQLRSLSIVMARMPRLGACSSSPSIGGGRMSCTCTCVSVRQTLMIPSSDPEKSSGSVPLHAHAHRMLIAIHVHVHVCEWFLRSSFV